MATNAKREEERQAREKEKARKMQEKEEERKKKIESMLKAQASYASHAEQRRKKARKRDQRRTGKRTGKKSSRSKGRKTETGLSKKDRASGRDSEGNRAVSVNSNAAQGAAAAMRAEEMNNGLFGDPDQGQSSGARQGIGSIDQDESSSSQSASRPQSHAHAAAGLPRGSRNIRQTGPLPPIRPKGVHAQPEWFARERAERLAEISSSSSATRQKGLSSHLLMKVSFEPSHAELLQLQRNGWRLGRNPGQREAGYMLNASFSTLTSRVRRAL